MLSQSIPVIIRCGLNAPDSMNLQILQRSVRLLTTLTHVWFLSGMRSGVFSQPSQACKTRVAYAANERLLACVNSLVIFELGGSPKCLVAFNALVPTLRLLSHVHMPFVGAHIRRLRESLSTMPTFVWHFACVTSLVDLKMMHPLEGHSTLATSIRTLLVVSLSVEFEGL